MAIRGIGPTHVQCLECGTRTPVDDPVLPDDAVCRSCEERDQSPTNVQLVAVIPCPDGITGTMYATGLGSCVAEEHENLTGQHVIKVED